MSYASVISQPGSAARNVGPVLEALGPLVGDPQTAAGGGQKRILELASFPYEHMRYYGAQWPDVHFTGTVRDAGEMGAIPTDDLPPNVDRPRQLDIAVDSDWAALRAATREQPPFDGVIMLNLVHCTPEGLPEHVFRNLSPRTPAGRALLAPHGWIAAYGPFLHDDGTFRSEGDAQFDREHIKSADAALGLRTPASVSMLAARWGFVEVVRDEMPKGNLWMVWTSDE